MSAEQRSLVAEFRSQLRWAADRAQSRISEGYTRELFAMVLPNVFGLVYDLTIIDGLKRVTTDPPPLEHTGFLVSMPFALYVRRGVTPRDIAGRLSYCAAAFAALTIVPQILVGLRPAGEGLSLLVALAAPFIVAGRFLDRGGRGSLPAAYTIVAVVLALFFGGAAEIGLYQRLGAGRPSGGPVDLFTFALLSATFAWIFLTSRGWRGIVGGSIAAVGVVGVVVSIPSEVTVMYVAWTALGILLGRRVVESGWLSRALVGAVVLAASLGGAWVLLRVVSKAIADRPWGGEHYALVAVVAAALAAICITAGSARRRVARAAIILGGAGLVLFGSVFLFAPLEPVTRLENLVFATVGSCLIGVGTLLARSPE